MKTTSAALTHHLAGEVTTLATLWKVKRRDAQIFGFTDHDRDLAYDDGSGDGPITYVARSGYTRTAIESTADLAVDNLMGECCSAYPACTANSSLRDSTAIFVFASATTSHRRSPQDRRTGIARCCARRCQITLTGTRSLTAMALVFLDGCDLYDNGDDSERDHRR